MGMGYTSIISISRESSEEAAEEELGSDPYRKMRRSATDFSILPSNFGAYFTATEGPRIQNQEREESSGKEIESEDSQIDCKEGGYKEEPEEMESNEDEKLIEDFTRILGIISSPYIGEHPGNTSYGYEIAVSRDYFTALFQGEESFSKPLISYHNPRREDESLAVLLKAKPLEEDEAGEGLEAKIFRLKEQKAFKTRRWLKQHS